MDIQTALQAAETLLQPIASQMTRPAADRLDAVITAAQLPAAVQALIGAHWGYLSAITGLDVPPPAAKAGEPVGEGSIEALYHFAGGGAVATLRMTVPYSAASIPSICHLIPSATLYERELAEMLGVVVAGTPDTDHLLLPDEWPADIYPLRKSFTGKLAEVEKV